LLLTNRPEGRLLRHLESWLWRDVSLLLTSSPAFVHRYFQPRRFPAPIKLIENKVLQADGGSDAPTRTRPRPGPPWRIGWFGMIRCRKSLRLLSSLTRAMDGRVEVIIRGRPSMAAFPDFDAVIAGEPYIRFGGGYRNPEDLPAIYGDAHLCWAIDYSEEGENSAWLLPNRLYEASLHGVAPIALGEVETGRWLARRGVGVVLDDPIGRRLAEFFGGLDEEKYTQLAAAMGELPQCELINDRSDCRALVEAVCAADASAAPTKRRGDAYAPAARLHENARQVP
jgi:glycosyltransferase involved in cell wall biosynthesis